MTRIGGAEFAGVIFEWNPVSNVFTKKVDFRGIDGRNPYGSLTLKDDKFYGMSSDGGASNLGVIFEWDPTSNAYTKRIEFNGTNGQSPSGSLTLKDDKFYGMTIGGGANDQGVIFEWNPATNTYTKKVDFNGTNGANPVSSLTVRDNKFYGMTREGGANNQGVIFEWDPATNTYTKKVDFNGTNGGLPYGSLTLKDDKFYGMTSAGGSNDYGVIFEWDPATNTYTKKADFNGTNGQFPFGNLTFKDGKFYGMTREGGANDQGVIFEWDPATNTYTKKVEFNGTNGQFPSGSLTFKDGKFYGMTSAGGSNDYGVIFEWDPVGNTYLKLADFNGANGRNPQYGHLVDNEPPDTSPPTAPKITTVTASETSVTLNWTAAKDNKGVVGYDIKGNKRNIRNPKFIPPKLLGTTTALSFTIDELEPCTAYTFFVTAKDAAGNTTASNTVNVTTTDETPPVSPNLPDITGCSVTLTAPTTTDNCAGEVTGTTTDPLTYDIPGTYTVTWTFNDGNHNTTTATQNVEITIGFEPVFIAANACFGEGITFTDNSTNIENGAAYLWDFGDGNTSTTAGDVTHTYATDGEYTVSLTITQEDCPANSIQTVKVHPLPEVTLDPFEKVCPGTPAFALTGGLPEGGVYNGDFVSDGAFDPIASGAGSFPITYTFTDGNGCENSTTQTLVVNDDAPPVVVTQDLTLALDKNGEATITPEQIDNGSSFSCSGASFSLNQTLFTCDDMGEHTVTLTLTEGNGNTATGTATVTVVDDNPPQITTPDDIVVDNDPDLCGAVITLETPVTSDNCGVQEVSNNAPEVFEGGTTIVTWMAVDVNGNESTTTQTVEVTNHVPILGDIIPSTDSVMIGNTLTVSAPFTDNNLSSAEWDWGDDNFTAGQMDTDAVTGNHSYDVPGVYTLNLSVTDACGEQDMAAFQSVVVYDPEELVTGIEDDFVKNSVKETGFEVNIYPNPVVGHTLYAECNSDHKGRSIVRIIDMSGQVLTEQEVGIISGVNRIVLNAVSLSRGQYVVYFEMDGSLEMKKVIKY